MSLHVIRAEKAGACYGVQRALDIAHKALDEGKDAGTLGALIHNPLVVSDLAAKGMKMLDDVEDIGCEAVIIRSHGVTPEVYRSLESQGKEIIDATCPHVARAQKAAAELAQSGQTVFVIGEQGHPEVEGLKAFAKDKGADVYVVLTEEDFPDVLPESIGIVVQTTQSKERLDSIVDALTKHGITPTVSDTICSATKKRQVCAEKLAQQVDVMIVIGGKNSSNTTRLAEICSKHCPSTFHIECASELDSIDLSGFTIVGVTAGASTPDAQIEEAIAALNSR